MTNATEQEYRRWTTAELKALPGGAVLEDAGFRQWWFDGTIWIAESLDSMGLLRLSTIGIARRVLRRIR